MKRYVYWKFFFYVEEIKEDIWENEFDKSQRPDKFNMGFFKVYWNTIKEDLVAYVNEFYSSHKLPKAILASFLTLIPKKENPQEADDFCPICLVSSLYTIVVNILASRLKKVMPNLIARN